MIYDTDSRKERTRKYLKRMADAETLFTASRSPLSSVTLRVRRGWISGMLQDHARSRVARHSAMTRNQDVEYLQFPLPFLFSTPFLLAHTSVIEIPVSTFLSLSLPCGEQQQQVSAGTFVETARDARGWKRRGQPGASREQGRIPPLYL